MNIYTLRKAMVFSLVLLTTGMITKVSSQIPAQLEKELVQFNAEIYNALKLLNTLDENEVVTKLEHLKPKLKQQAKSIASQISNLPELDEQEENAFMSKLMEKQLFKDMMALMSDRSFQNKIEESQILQKEYKELMDIMDTDSTSSEEESVILTQRQVSSFQIGTPSPLKGNYIVTADEEEAYAYMDYENEQFTVEIHGDNYIDILLFVEKPIPGRVTFYAEMQVAIDISINNGEDYFGLDNRYEEGGGYIQFDRIDEIGGIVSGSFQGEFNDSSIEGDIPVIVSGSFSVIRK